MLAQDLPTVVFGADVVAAFAPVVECEAALFYRKLVRIRLVRWVSPHTLHTALAVSSMSRRFVSRPSICA